MFVFGTMGVEVLLETGLAGAAEGLPAGGLATVEFLLLLKGALAILIVLDELVEHLSHEVVVLLDELLLLVDFLLVLVDLVVHLLLRHVLEHSFHLLVIFGDGEAREGHKSRFPGRVVVVVYAPLVVDHSVEGLQVVDWLQVLEGVAVVRPEHKFNFYWAD